MISGAIIFFCQQELYLSFSFIRDLSFFNYHSVSIFFGLWVGLGALGGDLIKSFFKRRLAIAPGQPWIPFDQIDWILGALLSFTVVFRPSFVVMVVSLIIGLTLHFLIKYIGFLWKLSATPL